MELHEIVRKLIGNTRGVGESNEDAKRLVNIKEQTELIDELLDGVITIARDKDSYQSSVKAIGNHADEFITHLREKLNP